MDEKGYKGHKPGSRKGRVHEVFDLKGLEAATKFGVIDLGLSPFTIKSWASAWEKAPKKSATPAGQVSPTFDLIAFRTKVLSDLKHFTIVFKTDKGGLRGHPCATGKDAIKAAKKFKTETIWAVDHHNRFVFINKPDWPSIEKR